MQQDATTRDALAIHDRPLALRLSNILRRIVDAVGRVGAWFIIPLVFVTVVDVVSRKLVWHQADGSVVGVQIWLVETFGSIFESTLLQELEWHFHTVLFALVLGFGTIYNTHVRVDLVRDHLHFRKKIWLEFLGLTLFMIPYLLLVIWFATAYVRDSYAVGEISASTVGLTHRWIIKTVLVSGLFVAMLAGVAAWLQVATLLWGRRDRRFPLMTLEWPEEAGTKIEGKDRISLEDAGPIAPSPALRGGLAGKPAE